MASIDPVQIKIKLTADKKGADDAKEALGGFGGSMQRIGEIAAGMGLERVAEKIIEIGKGAAEFALETASSFETSKAQFDVLLGSVQAGSKMMAELAKYEPHTSFDFSQLTNATQQLLALGVAQKDIIPDMKMLGDISLGNVDHLNHLAYTFGQVKDQTKLSAMQVREFIQGSNVDILQLLTNYLNKQGVAYTGVATAAGGATTAVAKHGKATKDTALALTTLNQNIAETELRTKILGETNDKAATKADKHSLAIMTQTNKLADYKQKLTDATQVTTKASGAVGVAGKLNAQQVKQMITDGDISFAQVQGALKQSTEKGGIYFQAMQQHMGTFSGLMSSIRTQFQQTALAVMGFDMDKNSSTFGELKQGTIFDQLKKGAQALLDFLNSNKENIASGFKSVAGAMKLIADISLSLWGQIVGAFTPAIKELTNVYVRHKAQIDTIAQGLGVLLYGALVVAINAVALLIRFATAATDCFLDYFGPGLKFVSSIIVAVGNDWSEIVNIMKSDFEGFVNSVISGINALISAINKLPGVHLGTLSPISFAQPGNTISHSSLTGGGLSQPTSSNFNIYNTNHFNGPGSGQQAAASLNFQLSTLKS